MRSRRPNNDRNTKHGRGGRNPPRDGKRAYDRRSGTGRGKEIKKGGGGARNWGSDKADAKKMEGKIDEEAVNEEPPKETEGEEPPVAEEAPVEEEKPEDNTMTFADYMASKGKKEADTGRQVESEFKGVSASKKVEEDFLVMGGGKQKKTTTEIGMTYEEVQTARATFCVAPIAQTQPPRTKPNHTSEAIVNTNNLLRDRATCAK